MVLFLIILLYGSIVGMILLVVLKSIELKRDRLFFSSARPMMTHVSYRIIEWVASLPVTARRLMVRTGYVGTSIAKHAVANGMLWIEHRLERVLERLRHTTTDGNADSTTSPFLREVAEHKKMLMRRRIRDREKTEERI